MNHQIDDFECPICFEEFNHLNKRPKTVTPCTHTICEECLPNISYCPKCRQVITGSTIAYSLLGAIEQFSRERLELLRLRASAETQKSENERNVRRLEELQLELAKQNSLQDSYKNKQAVLLPTRTEQMTGAPYDAVLDQIEKLKLEINQLKSEKEAQNKEVSKLEKPVLDMLLVRGLPKHVTQRDVFKWIFHNSPSIRDGSDGVSLRETGNKQNCIVVFDNEDDARKVISKWNRKAYPGTENILSVDYLRKGRPGKKKTVEDPQEMDKRVVFLCGLPANIGVDEVMTWIFKNNKKLIKSSIKLTSSGSGQRCRARYTDEAEAKRLIDEWNGKEYPGTSRRLKVDYYMPKKSEKEEKRPSAQKPPKIEAGTSKSCTPPMPSASSGISQRPRKPRSGSSWLPELTSIIVKNLPYSATKADMVSIFHNKVVENTRLLITANANQECSDFIEFLDGGTKNPGGHNGMCKITFTTSTAAQLAVKEFTNEKFPGTNRRLVCDIWHLAPRWRFP